MAKYFITKISNVRSSRLVPLMLLLAFVLSQTLGLAHLYHHQATGHQSEGDSDHCAVCLEAAHLWQAVLPGAVVMSTPSVITQAHYEEALHLLQIAALHAYASRAPPYTV